MALSTLWETFSTLGFCAEGCTMLTSISVQLATENSSKVEKSTSAKHGPMQWVWQWQNAHLTTALMETKLITHRRLSILQL